MFESRFRSVLRLHEARGTTRWPAALVLSLSIGLFFGCGDGEGSPTGASLFDVAPPTTAQAQAAAVSGERARPGAPYAVQPSLQAVTDIHTPGGVTLEPLARGTFPHPIDAKFKFSYGPATAVSQVSDASDVITARLTVAEGGSVGWHRHPSIAIGVVQAGTFGVIEETDCVVRTYEAGETFFHRGQGILDVGYNAGEGDAVVYVTFLGVPAGESPTVPHENGDEDSPCG